MAAAEQAGTPPPPQAVGSRSGKREGCLSWDDYFMSVAFLTGMRSKDPSTQVGAVIVNTDNRIVGIGYNGFPSGIPDEALPWEKTSPDGYLETKYPYVCHAELNAVLNKNVESCKGCRLYSTLFPCCECAKVIIQAGIRHVVFASDKNKEQDVFKASKRMFTLAGVKMESYVSEATELRIPLRYPGDGPPAGKSKAGAASGDEGLALEAGGQAPQEHRRGRGARAGAQPGRPHAAGGTLSDEF
mmetsp:Transcript_50192/g.144343  ORF Transcript_50192/g.144343 Transcript_50192/m.144343 type:complete len:243 (-) Transcript_50192:68-796(-)